MFDHLFLHTLDQTPAILVGLFLGLVIWEALFGGHEGGFMQLALF